MAHDKEDSGFMEMVAVAALLFLFWKFFIKKQEIPEPATTPAQLKDQFAKDPNFNLNDYCKDVIYRPLSSSDLTLSNLRGEGWCYRGDRSAIDESKGFGDAYAEKQAENYQSMKEEEAIIVNNKESIQFRLINSMSTPVTTDILNTTKINTPFDPVPISVVATAASGVTSSGFTANWNILTGVSGYFLDIATDINFFSFVTGYNGLDVGNVLSEVITGLIAGNTYYYRLRAYNDSGEGANSNIITVYIIPDACTALAATNRDYDNFTANLSPSFGATGYFIDVATDSLFSSIIPSYNNLDIGDVPDILIENLSAGTVYYYRFRAYNDGGTSSNSNTITVTTKVDYQDFWLPSKNETDAMYDELELYGVGDFESAPLDCFYATSSELSALIIWGVQFDSGVNPSYSKSAVNLRFRPCRKFTSSDIYALRDTGQAGGLIFHINDNGDGTYDYYEAYTADFKPAIPWSNIDSTEIGPAAQGTAIGTGESNTAAIVAQSGHINSFSKICNELIVTV